jgi:hypothetical protein
MADKADTDQLTLDALAAIGFKRSPIWRLFRSETILIMLALAISLLILALNLAPSEPKRLLQALATISGTIVLSLGYLQWRAARHESSFDKYYDKLDIANRRFDSWRIEALKNQPEDLQSHLRTMFIFAELDNLEYVLEKYKLGYVRQGLVRRAIRTFRSRCEDQAFCDSALYWIGAEEGEQKAFGYERTTRDIIRYIIRSKSP